MNFKRRSDTKLIIIPEEHTKSGPPCPFSSKTYTTPTWLPTKSIRRLVLVALNEVPTI